MPTDQKHHRLAIILLNYQTPDLVVNCMQSLQAELRMIDAVCCVVDNDSQDQSAVRIASWIDENDEDNNFHLLEAKENRGFSAGNNIGIQYMNADYYMLLNSDTLARPNVLQKLLKTADENPGAGLIMPRLEWPDEKPQISCFRFPSPFSELMGAAGTGIVTRLFRKYIIAIPVKDTLSYPPWASFACVMIRQELINQIGVLDDDYFMYFEDTDYCFFTRQAGWEIIHEPSARIVHLRGGSSSVKASFKNKTRVPAYYMAARSRYFYRTGGRTTLFIANLAWHAGRSVSKLREILGHSKMVSEKQARDIWINWKTPGKLYKPKR